MSTKLKGKGSRVRSSSQKSEKNDMKASRKDDVTTGYKQLTLAEATPLKAMGDARGETVMLMELRKLRQENTDSIQGVEELFTLGRVIYGGLEETNGGAGQKID
ncbi:hypothetical protein ATANTOWER_029637 [Ataeniobius toweri]|uniref:Uncharacterized protein n=1 Tax=Ataeniobius toweri TaxID=208326 RepID=A0ABU7AS41_9TELE|nr:hypothetical protein [Ataeniobius toweri]